MEKTYTTTPETARYLNAVLKLQEGTSLAMNAAEEIYGNLNSPTGEELIEPFRQKMNEAIDELFKLIQANIEVNLGFLDNSRQDTVKI